MPEFKSIQLTFKKYQPLHDAILVTAKSHEEKDKDIVDTKKQKFLLYVQDVVAVGKRVPEELGIKVGDQVHLDTTSIFRDLERFQDDLVVMNDDWENPFLLVPTRFVKAVVEAEEQPFLEDNDLEV